MLLSSVTLLAASTGTIEGTVRINSEPTGGAVVYLLAEGGDSISAHPVRKTIRQERLKFIPPFAVVPRGSTIRFENHDNEIHNVNSKSRGNRFDVGAHMPGTIQSVVLDRSGPVILRCRIHPDMRGAIFVTPSSYFALADDRGVFTIPDVPYGNYRVEAWHPRLSEEEVKAGGQPIYIESGGFRLELGLETQTAKGNLIPGYAEQNWDDVITQIGLGLGKAIKRWKAGKRTSAMREVMTSHSRHYGESGLSEAIQAWHGKERSEEHERRFSDLTKRILAEKHNGITEALLIDEKNTLLDALRHDVAR